MPLHLVFKPSFDENIFYLLENKREAINKRYILSERDFLDFEIKTFNINAKKSENMILLKSWNDKRVEYNLFLNELLANNYSSELKKYNHLIFDVTVL